MALLICPNPSTSLYGHTYASRRGVLEIFVWTRQVVLTSQSTFCFPLGKIHQLTYWKHVPSPFPPPSVKEKLVCSSSGWHFRSEDQLLLCVFVQYPSDTFHVCSARTLQTRSRKYHMLPLCGDVGVTASWEIQAKKLEFGPLGVEMNLYRKLQFWFYNISLWYTMAPLPTGVYTRPHRWNVAASCSPEMTYSSTPTPPSHGTTSAVDEPCICTRLRDFPGCRVVAG